MDKARNWLIRHACPKYTEKNRIKETVNILNLLFQLLILKIAGLSIIHWWNYSCESSDFFFGNYHLGGIKRIPKSQYTAIICQFVEMEKEFLNNIHWWYCTCTTEDREIQKFVKYEGFIHISYCDVKKGALANNVWTIKRCCC